MTFYDFHEWIEASETANTVWSDFGQWWDGDAAPSGTTLLPLNNHYMMSG